MKPILIIKTGRILSSLRQRRGDFEDWFFQGCGLPASAFEVINVEAGELLPEPAQFRAALITGSLAMVSDHLDWSENSAQWIKNAIIQYRLPTLGICYGHQLLAYALGGSVDYNPNGLECGQVEVNLTAAAASDRLLSVLPSASRLFVAHSQSVLSLPAGAVLLASSRLEPHQAFCYDGLAWGLQFHPEFDADITRTCIAASRDTLMAQAQDPDQLSSACSDNLLGSQVLQRFVSLVS